MGRWRQADSISDWLGRFHNPDLEARFARHVQAESAAQLVRSALVAAAMFAAFGLSDYALLGSDNPAVYALLGLRAVVVAATLLLVAAVRQYPALVNDPWPTNAIIALGVTAIILIVPLRPATIDTQAPAVMVAAMAIYLFFPNRTPWRIGQNLYLSIGFLLAAWLLAPVPARAIVTYVLLLLLVNVVGLMTAMRLSRLRRVQFATLLEEREVNDRLQSEIAARQHLERRLTRLASTDELTGVNNRRRVTELADQVLRLARREGSPVAVCMVDLDHFKAINDRYGHAAGDSVLVAVAERLRAVLRESDILGRFGGEEFVVVLPRTDQAMAEETAERLRCAVAGMGGAEFGLALRVTATVGVAEVRPGEWTIEQALNRADDALYEGKRRGRDCVVTAGEGADDAVSQGPAAAGVKKGPPGVGPNGG